MKRLILCLTAVLLGAASWAQPGGKVIESRSLKSGILGKDVNYSVYLPADYDTSDRKYPVLYLLHGSGGDETNWVQPGEVKRIADGLIESGEATPIIIVMPDGQESWYLNDYSGRNRYEDMFVEELIPHVEAQYRARPGKSYRAIAGLSMGGYGSLLYALHHPDLFAASAALSAAVFTDEDLTSMKYKRFALFSKLCGEDVSKGIVNDHWKKNSVLHLVEGMPDGQKRKVKFYIDCGDDDFLYKGNSALHVLMRDKGVTHQYRVRDGGHSWEYWRTGLADVLPFVSRSFRFQN